MAASGIKPMTAADLGVGMAINGFFMALSLADLSFCTWALHDLDQRRPALQAYYTWSAEQPIIGVLMLLLVLVLPFALYGMITEDVVGLCKRPAHVKRHAYGTATLVGIVVIIAAIVTVMKPEQQRFVREGGDASFLWTLHVGHVLFNVLMTALAAGKFAASSATDATGDSTVKPVKPKQT